MARRFAVIIVSASALAWLAGCAPAGDALPSPTPSNSSPSPAASPSSSPVPSSSASGVATLEVLCDEDLNLIVSSPAVDATAGGVELVVTSEAPTGAYLNYGIGGDELPTETATWLLAVPPGEMTLSCSTLEQEGDVVTVAVTDPDGYWSTKTLEEFGCPIAGIPDWAISAGSGDTTAAALAELADNANEIGQEPRLTRWERAAIGYPEAETQIWILGSDDETQITAMVNTKGGTVYAGPDMLCEPSPWPSDN